MPTNQKLEAWLGAPPERDEAIVQLFVESGLWAELSRENGRWILEVAPSNKPVRFDADEFLAKIHVAIEKLKSHFE